MPWTAKQAAEQNKRVKGSPKLQKRWAAVANSVLAAELKKGAKQAEAEGHAIAAANTAVKKKPKTQGPRPKAQGRAGDDVAIAWKRAVAAAKKGEHSPYVQTPPPVARAAEMELRTRLAAITPATLDEDLRTVRAVLATEAPCISLDLRTGKGFLEVYLMSGMEPVLQVPLCDTHQRDSIDRVKGSAREITVSGDQVSGDLCVADTEHTAWSKIRGRHITDVSAGFAPIETTEIKAGKSATILGRTFTAPADRSLFVHTKWRLREVSLTPFGSDVRAKIRNQGVFLMNQHIRKWLEANAGLATEATAEDAQTLWDTLPSADRTRAEANCKERSEDDDEEEDEEDDEEDDEEAGEKAKKEKERKARKARAAKEDDEKERKAREARAAKEDDEKERKARSAEEIERVRAEALAEGRQAELHRQERIRTLAGDDLPAEVRDRAIKEGWKLGRVRRVFLQAVRDGRSKSVGGGGNTGDIEMTRALFGAAGEDRGGPAIHSRSHEADCTVGTLAASLLTRSYSGGQDPCDLLGGYQPGPSMISEEDGKPEKGRAYYVRPDVHRMIAGRTRQAGEERRKLAERLLDLGDRYRGMGPMDFVDECNRIEGRARTTYDKEERVRAAMSGSALSAIYTQNVAAQFLGGYLDAADTTAGWVTETDVPNFLQNERAIYGKFGVLKKLGKGGTAEDLDTSDWNEVYKIFRYAAKFAVDEQDFINDRFGAIAQMSPQDMGLAARQVRPNLVYAILLSNPTLGQDGYSIFDGTHHNNVITGQITDFGAGVASANPGPIQDATSAMGKQRLRNRVLNLRPRYIIGGTDMQVAFNRLYAPQNLNVTIAGTGTIYNPDTPNKDSTQPICDGRLDPLGCYDNDTTKTFYPYTTTGTTAGRSGMAILAARPGEQGAKTLEVGYRVGTGRAPRIRAGVFREGEGRWGMSWDVNLDIGAKALDFRGFVLLTGGGSQQAASGVNSQT